MTENWEEGAPTCRHSAIVLQPAFLERAGNIHPLYKDSLTGVGGPGCQAVILHELPEALHTPNGAGTAGLQEESSRSLGPGPAWQLRTAKRQARQDPSALGP